MNRRNFIIRTSAVTASAGLPMHLLAKGTRGGAAQPPLHSADFSSFAEQDTLDLFLLVGQSNMKGRGAIEMNPVEDKNIVFFHSKQQQWYIARDPLHAQGIPDKIDGSDNSGTGPGMSFAQTLALQDKQLKIGLIPGAVGGAPIDSYGKGAKLYQRSLALTEEAIKQSKPKTRIKAILWLQGESDAVKSKHDSYEGKLLDMIDRYRSDLKNPTLPFIACTLGSYINKGPFQHVKEVNKVLLALPEKRKHTACIDARDLKGHIGDRLHYDTASQLEIGKRFAAAYLKMTQK
jgi:hypothetical protein